MENETGESGNFHFERTIFFNELMTTRAFKGEYNFSIFSIMLL